jgi:NitT/TauT family transport system substrate-binding protein
MPTKSKSGWVAIIGGVVIVVILMILHGILEGQPSIKRPHYLALGIQNDGMSSLAIIAKKEGLFKKLGLNVRLVPYSGGKLALQALLHYKVDMATVSNIPILINAFRDENFSIVATINEAESMSQVVVRKGRGIESPRDLIGKRIGTVLNSGGDYYAYLFLKYYSIPVSDVQLVYMPAKKLVMALRSGYIDAFVLGEPYASEAGSYMPGEISYFSIPNLYKVHLNLVVMNAGLKEHLNKIKLVILGLHQAFLFEQKNKQAAQNDVVAFLGEPRRAEILAAWPHYNFNVSLPDDLIPSLTQQSSWVISLGKGVSANMPSFKKLINSKPLEQVKAGKFTSLEPQANKDDVIKQIDSENTLMQK